jgi:hypothetical protein
MAAAGGAARLAAAQTAPAPGSSVPGQPREVVALRTRTSRTFDRPNGARVAEIHTGSIHFQDPSATVSVDPAWLADPARQWPVVIDPRVVLQGTTQSQDCDIKDDNVNQCASTDPDVGINAGFTPFRSRDLLQFDLSSIPGTSTVVNADLALNLFQTTTTTVPVNLHQLQKPWTSGVTWNTTDGRARPTRVASA